MNIEKENLKVSTNVGNAKKMITIDPLSFTFKAWREILRYQIFCKEPREILIANKGQVTYISESSIRNARFMFKIKRRKLLNDTAKKICKSDAVIILELADE